MSIKYRCNYVKSLLKRYGFKGLVLKTIERSRSPMLAYTDCYRQFLPLPPRPTKTGNSAWRTEAKAAGWRKQ